MNQDIQAINENNLENLIVNLTDLSVTISEYLNDMSKLIFETSEYFQGEASEAVRSKFSEIELEFPTLIRNLESYKDDFIKIKNNHIGFDKALTTSDVENLNMGGGDYSGVN